MGFPRQEYWRGFPFPSLGDSPDPGIESGSSALQADSLLTELQGKSLVFYSFTKDLLYKYSSKDENVKILLAPISCD